MLHVDMHKLLLLGKPVIDDALLCPAHHHEGPCYQTAPLTSKIGVNVLSNHAHE
jgi:hypothetical protein